MKEVRQQAERHEENIRKIEEFDPNLAAGIREMGRRITETRRLGVILRTRARAILRTRTRAMITRHVEEQIRDGR